MIRWGVDNLIGGFSPVAKCHEIGRFFKTLCERALLVLRFSAKDIFGGALVPSYEEPENERPWWPVSYTSAKNREL